MAFIPYSCQTIEDDDVQAVVAALRSEYLTQGPAIPAFEAAFAAQHGVAHAVAVNNATSALHMACVALGVGAGSLVWTSPNSFVASANCARYCGATVDFVDIDSRTRNMSTDALREKLTAAEKAGKLPDVVIPVDFSGLPCDLREIRALADQYGFRIIEDASHATGAVYQDKPVGGQYADIVVFSFHAVKILTTAEGGMLTTADPELDHKLRLLRSHGITRDTTLMQAEPDGPWYYEQVDLGFNYRLTDLQAALGLSQLARLPAMQAQRTALADTYDRLLADLPLALPHRANDKVSSWHLYAVELTEAGADRGTVFSSLRNAGIGVNVHYMPIHLQPYYRDLGFSRGDFPAAEAYYAKAISLPLFPKMSGEQQAHVVESLKTTLGR